MSRWPSLALALALAFAAGAALAAEKRLGIGRAPTAAEIAGWDIDVDAEGRGLPPGGGTVKDGEVLYQTHCVACHGDFGEGAGRYPELVGGVGTLASEDPRRSVGSYWPYAPTLFDYIRRAMPFPAPQSLGNDEVYAITAYVLYLNDLLGEDGAIDAAGLPRIAMPNRNGFIQGGDPRPDVRNAPCTKNCRPEPLHVTSDLARHLGVTPTRTGD